MVVVFGEQRTAAVMVMATAAVLYVYAAALEPVCQLVYLVSILAGCLSGGDAVTYDLSPNLWGCLVVGHLSW
jgi:hypothetical protein